MALMGTSVGVPTASVESKVVFMEDMTTAEAAKVGVLAPSGLENLGNTCKLVRSWMRML